MKPINTKCRVIIVSAGGAYSYHWALKGKNIKTQIYGQGWMDVLAYVSMYGCEGKGGRYY
jgi:hypothetical protein